jgi:hypothetical protein
LDLQSDKEEVTTENGEPRIWTAIESRYNRSVGRPPENDVVSIRLETHCRALQTFCAVLLVLFSFTAQASAGARPARGVAAEPTAPADSAASLLLDARTAASDPLLPVRITARPAIDGVLDDPAWQSAPSITGFRTWLPDFGKPMGDETTVFYAYDEENIYFAFRALDSEPGRIKASMANRDGVRSDDWVCINLDSFNDQQALYAFYVNPLGIQMDSRFAANREDFGFDAVWESAGRVDADGYSVEVRIPFKSIRYHGREPVMMGVVFERFVSRRQEDGTWPALDPKAGMNFLIQMQPIAFTRIRHYTLLEVLPDLTYSQQHLASGGQLSRVSSRPDVGVTAKYGIAAQLTADGTFNPDFSQVEADAGQIDINLRAPLFFAEKRPFFLESQEVFNLGGPSQEGPLQAFLHTRTIVNPLVGLKVSGKLAPRDTLAVLYSADEQPADASASTTDYAHVAVARYKRSLKQDSYLGAFFAGREQGPSFNRVVGADGALRLDRSTSLGFYALASGTRTGDPSETAGGHAGGIALTRDTRRLALSLVGLDISTGFATQTGYLTRSGVTTLGATVGPRFYPKRGIVQRLQVSATSQQTRDAFSGTWETWNEASVSLMLQRAASVGVGYHRSSEVFAGEEFGTSGMSVTASTQLTKQLRLQGSFSRGDAIYYSEDPFGGSALRASASIVLQPSEQWYEALTVTYASFDRAADGLRLYDYAIVRNRASFQVNRFLFFRAILEYNSFRRQLLTDFLGSFTYIPGTVVHAGYGSLYERLHWDGAAYVPGRAFLETRRGLFLKASYLWRL